jgi:RNA polymerase primary sigma factor
MPRPPGRRAAAPLPPLALYLREIDATPALDAEEERQLALRVRGGDWEARDRLVRANLRLVVGLARRYARRGLGLEDLIAEGNLGLLRAVEGFDPGRNTRFSTYAGYWVKQSLGRSLVNTSRAVRLPAHVVVLLGRWRRASAGLQGELGRPPTPEEVARRLDLPKRKLNAVKKALRACNSAPQGDQADSGRSLDEALPDGHAQAPDAGMAEADGWHHLLYLLGRLDQRKAAVLRLRFGLGDEGPKTLQEVGERLGVTRERVRQVEAEALANLREALEGAPG